MKTLALALICLGQQASGPVALLHWNTTECPPGAPSCQTSSRWGSGVLVGKTRDDKYAVVVTAAHIFRGYPASSGPRITVEINGQTLHADRGWLAAQKLDEVDLAMLLVPYRGACPCMPIAEEMPPADAEITLTGYDQGVTLVHRRGLFGRMTKTQLHWRGAIPTQGTSGGAVVCNGSLVAVVTGVEGSVQGRGGSGFGTHSEVIRAFVIDRLGYLPGCGSEPPPKPKKPEISVNEDSQDLSELKKQIAVLQARLEEVSNRKITVAVLDPDTGTVDVEDFPGTKKDPIRLRFKEAKNK